ncbi:hypothetical protein OROGR_029031 [Orobanche gracilis]
MFAPHPQFKRRRISMDGADTSISCHALHEVEKSLPALRCSGYYTKPCLTELAVRELMNPGYCSRLQDFVVGRVDYGYVKFIGKTDIRFMDLNGIVKFNRCEVVVYDDGNSKPLVGPGLNKLAEVTLLLQAKSLRSMTEDRLKEIIDKLKCKTETF